MTDTPAANTGAVQPEGREEVLVKPPVNQYAAIIFSELFNNEGMTIVGKVERICPRIEAYVANLIRRAELTAAIEELKYTGFDYSDDYDIRRYAKERLAALTAELKKLEENRG